MTNKWRKNVGALLLTLLLAVSLIACGSSGGGNGGNNSGNNDGNPEPPASTFQLVAVGESGTVVTSDDKDNWVIVQTGTSQIIWDVARGSWFAVGSDSGNGIIARSDDAGNWGVVLTFPDVVYFGIASNGSGTWIAVGVENNTDGVISRSLDNGNTWTNQVFTGSGTTFNEIAYGNGHWVIVGEGGAIKHSVNGIDWYTAFAGSNELTGIAYGNDHWIAVSKGGDIFHAATADLSIWSYQFTAPRDLTDIAYDGTGRWVTVGNDGIIFYSDDNGTTWTESKRLGTGNPSVNNLMGVVYDGTDWVAVGTASTTATKATIIHTRNGDIDIWDRASSAPATNENLHSIAFRP